MRHGRKNQHADVLSSFRKIGISWGSRPTVEWNETDYDVVGEARRLAGYRLCRERILV